MSGRVVHFEIPYDDGDRARAFYEKAFGWQLMSPPGMEYTLVTSGPSGDSGPTEAGFINGGMMQRQGPFTGLAVVDGTLRCGERVIATLRGSYWQSEKTRRAWPRVRMVEARG